MKTRILVGTDLSVTCDAALQYALLLGRALDAELVLVHVLDKAELPKGFSAQLIRNENRAFRKMADWNQANAERLIARQIGRVKGDVARDRITVRLPTGKPTAELLAAANKANACMIVLGLAEPPAGPGVVAQRLLASSRLPVLLVPTLPRAAIAKLLPTKSKFPPLRLVSSRAPARAR